jgi:hypothetical protein
MTEYSGQWAYGNAVDFKIKKISGGAYAEKLLGRWAFKNGESHRPQFEDVILSRIDAERALDQQRSIEDEAADLSEQASSPEAEALHAVRTEAHAEGVAEAASLRARHALHAERGPVRSWHAPRSEVDPEEEG